MAGFLSTDPRSTASNPYLPAGYGTDPLAAWRTALSPEEAALEAAALDLGAPGLGLAGDPDALARQQAIDKAMGKEFRTNLSIAGLIGGAQVAAQAIPTAQDKYNKERAAYLKAHPGLDPAEEEQFKAMAAGLAQASAQRGKQAEGLQASMGNVSAAAQMRPSREAARQDIDAFIKAGAAKAAAIARATESKASELAQLKAIPTPLERAGGAVVQTAPKIAEAIAKARAGKLTPGLDISALTTIEDPVDRARFMRILQSSTPAEQEQLMLLLTA